MIKSEVVAHSLSPQKDELISILGTFPRIILAEVNTHRMLSKNTSSSRAIPFLKMVEAIKSKPFIPIAYQKEHKGMQGTEYFTDINDIAVLNSNHLHARDEAISKAVTQSEFGLTKQLCNRYLEPFMWTTMLITGPREGWENFFELRCPQYELHIKNPGVTYKSRKDLLKEFPEYERNTELEWLSINKGQAEIHMMALAESIYDAVNESTPLQLEAGEWHIPFGDKIYYGDGFDISDYHTRSHGKPNQKQYEVGVKISTAMSARTSYTVVGEEKAIDYEQLIALHDRLIGQDPPHSSPMEHCARAMTYDEYDYYIKGEITILEDSYGNHNIYNPNGEDNHVKGWCRNFKGFIPYRHIVETK